MAEIHLTLNTYSARNQLFLHYINAIHATKEEVSEALEQVR
jgi:hypothetical protein